MLRVGAGGKASEPDRLATDEARAVEVGLDSAEGAVDELQSFARLAEQGGGLGLLEGERGALGVVLVVGRRVEP